MTCTHVCPVGMSRMSCVVAGTFSKVRINVRTFLPRPDATRTKRYPLRERARLASGGWDSAGRVEGGGCLCNEKGRRREGGRLLE